MIKLLQNYLAENSLTIGKFFVVGASAAVIDFGLLYLLTEYGGIYYLVSATISFVIAALYNYFMNRRWTFQSIGSKKKQIPIFFTVAILGIIFNNAILYIGVEQFAIWYIYAKVFATIVVTVWNFMWNKHVTFRVK